MLNLFIGQLDSKIDANHNLQIVAFHLKMHSADAQSPVVINIVLGLPARVCVLEYVLAKPRDKAAEIENSFG